MKKLTQKSIVFIALLGLVIPPVSLKASEFNPNFIISDEEMQNWRSMDRADIQAFLSDHGGYIANLRTEDLDGTKRLASDIIYRAAKDHEINPKYLLVKLQKEQSLITEDNPTQKQLDGATGYGITDGCGWECETYKNNKGFGKQVDSAAGIMRWYYDNYTKESWIKKANLTYPIDSTQVKPTNLATAFLYTYTPHIQGNQNFWTLWQRWFEQVYPNGSLIKATGDSTVYLIQNSQKRAIVSMTALVTRFDPKMILNVPASELSRYANGPEISLPNYSILKNGSKYYLLDFDTLRPFANEEVVRTLGYHPDEIIEVSNADIQSYTTGQTITADAQYPSGKIIRTKENNGLYYIKDNTYYPILDEQIAAINFPNLTIEDSQLSELHAYEKGDVLLFKEGTLFGIKGSNKIYVVEDGKKRHIASEEVYKGLGYSWKNIIWTDEFTGMVHETSQPIYLRSNVASLIETNEQQQEDSTSETAADPSADAQGNETVETENIAEKMQRTPADETVYIGTEFTTDVDAYLVADYETEEILAGKNVDAVRPTASFTKVMTGYRLLKEGLNMSGLGISTYDPAKHQSSYHIFRIAAGEQIRNQDLMYAMLISSLNTPSKILADQVASSEFNFIAGMNQQAKDWGLSETRFVDTSGIEVANKTTAREYLTLFKKATKNSDIKRILGMKEYEYDEVKDLDGKPHHFDSHSNGLVNKSGLPFKIIASKTGYLYEAGAGLVMLIERNSDKKQFVIITMGNVDYSHRFDEPERLAKWAVSEF